MTFDPFRDFDSLGYLRNFAGNKNIPEVKALEHVSFLGNDPGKGSLDHYLKPFIRGVVDRQKSAFTLKSLKGLGDTTI